MEKFMLLFQAPYQGTQASPQQMEETMGKWFAWINKLAQAGKYDSGEALLPTGKVLKGGHKNVTDGPFTEGKEIIGGYFIVNAKDYDEAVSLCEDYPDYATGGSVIVRQVQKIDMPA
ncbi:MAG: YciI family protein [Chitinophagaceae bacterium]|nr:YciI family protein [Chitinophagaceae bacterium]